MQASDQWSELIETMGLDGPTRMLAQHCIPITHERKAGMSIITLALDNNALKSRTPAREEKLAKGIMRSMGRPVIVVLVAGKPKTETPALTANRRAEMILLFESMELLPPKQRDRH